MGDDNVNELPDKFSETAAAYGAVRRKPKKRVTVTEREMMEMDPPCPAEPEWMAELEAEWERREREKAAAK